MNIYNRISKTPDKYATQLHASNDPQIVKMKNTTPFDRYIAQLCQIRGVSDKIARAIATMYPSMKMLIERFDDTIPIRVTDASGKSRNISKNIMKEIYDMTKI
jgi:hypothetical protein